MNREAAEKLFGSFWQINPRVPSEVLCFSCSEKMAGRVGKTSILLRYVRDEYNDKQVSTLQASYLDKQISEGAVAAQLSIWDTAGQERFHALGPIYYRDADGALLVYDITDADSFIKVQKWVKELRKMLGNEIVIAIAGNKTDLERQRTVSNEEAEEYAASVGAAHFLTSAKANKGLEEVFLALTTQMMEKAQTAAPEGRRSSRASAKLVILDDGEPEGQQSSCC